MSEVVDLLVFQLDDQRYGLPLQCLHGVERAVALTRLPGAPGVIEGAIDLRGQIIPVLDIRARFGLPPREIDPGQHLIIADAGARVVAIRTERALGLITVPSADIDAADSITPTIRQISGVAKLSDGLVLIHDLASFLTETEAIALEALLATDRGGGEEEHIDPIR